MTRQNCAIPVRRPNHASKTRDRAARLCNPLIALAFDILFRLSSPFAVEIATANLPKNILKILYKILLPAGATSLRGLKVFYDCSGGNSRPSRLSGVGGGNFLGVKRLLLSSCS
jgi:hypothetical protein